MNLTSMIPNGWRTSLKLLKNRKWGFTLFRWAAFISLFYILQAVGASGGYLVAFVVIFIVHDWVSSWYYDDCAKNAIIDTYKNECLETVQHLDREYLSNFKSFVEILKKQERMRFEIGIMKGKKNDKPADVIKLVKDDDGKKP